MRALFKQYRGPLSRLRRIPMGIRTKVIGVVLAVTIILTLVSMVYTYTTVRATLEEQLEQKGLSLAQNMAARSVEPVLTNNIFQLNELAYETLESNEDVVYVFIMDQEENILAHTFQDYFPPDLMEVEHQLEGDSAAGVQKFQAEDGVLRDIAVPVFNHPEPEAGASGATVRMGVLDYSVQSALSTITRQNLLISLFTFVLLSGLVYFFTTATTIKPLNSLLSSVKAVSQGDLAQEVTVKTGDELSQLARAFNTMTRRLSRTKEMRDSLLKKIIYTQEEERQRISRELHDETGQTLSTLMISLQLLEDSRDREEFKERSQEFRNLLQQSLEQVRLMAWRLSPTPLTDLGLQAALESFAKKYREHTNLEVELDIQGLEEKRIPSEIEASVYRIIQEALTNVSRHAQAQNVNIRVAVEGSTLSAAVNDDGVGFAAESSGREESPQGSGESLGLTSMQERASLVGGTFQIHSAPGKGTTIQVEIPLTEEQREVEEQEEKEEGGKNDG